MLYENRNSSIDLIKIILISLVIISHAGLPYFIGPGGLWYVRSATYNFNFFSPWNFSFNAFILNAFFFIAGIFSYYSLIKHDYSKFIIKRAKRILIPLILGFLFILPPLSYYYFIMYQPVTHVKFIDYYFQYWFGLDPKPAGWVGHYPDMNLGHLWFLEHLFIYSIILVMLFKLLQTSNYRIKIEFNYFFIILLSLIAVSTFIMKFYHPATEMTSLLGFIQLDYTHVLENCFLFYGGVLFAKFNYKNSLSFRTKKILFYTGLYLAILPFIIFYVFTSFSYLFNDLVFFVLWESFTAITFSIGSVIFLDCIITTYSGTLTLLGNATYGIYVFHVIFVVFFQIMFENIIINVIIKFAIVATLSVLTSFLSWLLFKLLYSKMLTNKIKIAK